MASPRVAIGIAVAAVVAAMVSMLIYAMMQQARVDCEVCVTFHGRTQCRSAAGPSPEEATRTAADNACAFLSSGMADTISCSHTPADSVQCSE